jgi:hypothetical protein
MDTQIHAKHGFLHYRAAGGSGFTGEICETGPERTVMLEGNAQFLSSRVCAMPGGSERILLLLDERDERLAAVVYETGRQFDSGAWIIDDIAWFSCQRVLSLAVALAAGDSGVSSGFASGTEKVMDLSASPWPAIFDSSAGRAITVAPGCQPVAGATG